MVNSKVKVICKLDDVIERIFEETGIRITKSRLSRKINVDPSQLYRWTKNKDDGYIETIPNVAHAILLAEALGCSVSDLFVVVQNHDDFLEGIFK